MAPFLRISFSNFEIDPGLAYHEEVSNPYCAVYMKEVIDTGQLLYMQFFNVLSVNILYVCLHETVLLNPE